MTETKRDWKTVVIAFLILTLVWLAWTTSRPDPAAGRLHAYNLCLAQHPLSKGDCVLLLGSR